MSKIIHNITWAALALSLVACSDDTFDGYNNRLDAKGQEITVTATIDQVNTSRADDSGFADGDRIGLYVVNNNDDGTTGTLLPAGNWVNNVGLTFNESTGRWAPDRPIYFKDDKTGSRFYSYYPFTDEISNPTEHTFTVGQNQQAESAAGALAPYEASDLLIACAEAKAGSASVNLIFRHIMAGVKVILVEGAGFEEGEWATVDKSVLVNNITRTGVVNIEAGTVTPTESTDGKSIISKQGFNGDFSAVVIPGQAVKAGESVLSITIDGTTLDYVRTEDTRFLPSKMHKFTMKVNKTFPAGDYSLEIIDESITAWESDSESHSGKVIVYDIVNVSEAGGLESAIKESGLDISQIRNLKITGELTQSDFDYIRNNITYLEAINLREVTLRNCRQTSDREQQKQDYTIPPQAFFGMKSLNKVVLPQKLLSIGNAAFCNVPLSGSLDLPEGLEYIGDEAFSVYNPETRGGLTGQLTIPSTVKYIGRSAFSCNSFSGKLILPEGLEHIGSHAFNDLKDITGEVHLPSSLKTLEEQAFNLLVNVTGELVLPRQWETVIAVANRAGFTSVRFPDAPREIGPSAFWGMENLRGDFIVPETVEKIGREAFCSANINHLKLPSGIEYIPAYMCASCTSLIDTITIPEGVEFIDEAAFNNCNKLDAVVLPSTLLEIKSWAFENCSSMTYIRCDATEPPAIEAGCFNGIAKDNFTIEVPEASVDAYRNAPGWSDFRRISAYRNFVARPQKFNVLNKGGEKEIILNADGDWTLTECPGWCHIDKLSGSMKTVLKLSVDAMPHGMGDRSGIITFKLNDSEGHLTHINIGQFDYEYEEDSYVQIQQASKGAGINLVFMGDGFDASDIASGNYLETMKQEAEYFFGVEPYLTYRDYFNVYVPFALSEDSGVETLYSWNKTKFGVKIGDGETRISAPYDDAMAYCISNIPELTRSSDPFIGCVLVANYDYYEGITNVASNGFCAVVTLSKENYPNDARGLVQHEAGGHGMGLLADEYVYHVAWIDKCPCACCAHADKLLSDQAWGFGLNLSLDGKYKNMPWYHLMHHPDYHDIVDVYEGGYFHSRGVYRSEFNSCMNNNVAYYSTWSRQLIVQRIKSIAGEEFDLDDFYANDSRETGKDFTRAGSRAPIDVETPARHGSHPVLVKKFNFGKGGNRK